MRTTSLLNDLIRACSGLILLLAVCHAAYAETRHDWRVLIGKQVRVERSLQTMLRRAEAAAFLPLELVGEPTSAFRWLLVREALLKSISMDVDQFNEMLGVISIDEAAEQLSLQQTISNATDSFRLEVRLELVSGRVKVSTRKLVD